MRSLFLVPVALFGLTALVRGQDPRIPQPKADTQVRVEVRGPVHEAFAQPYEAKPDPNKIINKQPPEPIAEQPPPLRPAGDNVQWIPGYWAWDVDSQDFVWASGFWRNAPENHRWVPGFWTEHDDGWVWVNGHWAAEAEADFQFVPEPPATRETFQTGNPPDTTSFYIPGTWFYSDAGWQWRDGYWADTRPGHVWVPAQYYWTPRGYVFSNGYWDYAPTNRGLLFAPVSIPGSLLQNTSFVFQPQYALPVLGLLDSLFINSGFGQYLFGNYFGNRFTGLGVSPWLTAGARTYDPLYSYLNASAGTDTSLGGLTLQALRSTLDARLAGRADLPPTTLADALRLNAGAGANANANANTNAAARARALIAPLTDLQQSANFRLSTLTDEQRQQYRQAAQQFLNQNAEIRRQFRAAVRGGATTPGVNVPGGNIDVGGRANVPGAGANIDGQGRVPGVNIPGVRFNPGGGIRINPGNNPGGGIRINPGNGPGGGIRINPGNNPGGGIRINPGGGGTRPGGRGGPR